jgi:hypothetical protein
MKKSFLRKAASNCDSVYSNKSGTDVMVTSFSDVLQFSAKKLAFFTKTNVMIKFLNNLALFWFKNAKFLPFIGENI